jgi:hypothetical protein
MVPNIDAMGKRELRHLIACSKGHVGAARILGEQWFPIRPRGFVRATRAIPAYAQCLWMVREDVDRGCEGFRLKDCLPGLFRNIPEWARWRREEDGHA